MAALAAPERVMEVDDLAALHAALRARGCYRRPAGRVLAELGLFLAIVAAALAVLIAGEGLAVRLAALLLMTLGSLGVAANTHTSSHYATSERRWLNELLTYFGCSFFLQFSATYWWHKHGVHHRSPNVIGVDADVDFEPLFALQLDEVDRCSRRRRRYYRLQWVLLPLAIAGNAVNMQIAGWRYLIGALARRRTRRREHWIDLGALSLHWVAWIAVPLSFFPPADVALFHLLRTVLLSYALFAAFAPAHLPAEALFVRPEQGRGDFVLRQTATTVNFRTGRIGRLLCAGLDHQIEHHLLPGLSHVCYPDASEVVRAYCERHGYPYRTLGWGEAIWKALLVFYRPKPVHRLEAVARSARRAATA